MAAVPEEKGAPDQSLNRKGIQVVKNGEQKEKDEAEEKDEREQKSEEGTSESVHFFCNLGMCIHSCPFITPGLRRTPKTKQRYRRRQRSASIRGKVEEQKVHVPEEKDEPAQKNEEAPSESVHSRVLSIVFVISFLYVGRLFFFSF